MDEDVWSQDCFDRLMADKPAQLAIDSETSGLTWVDKAFGVSFAWYSYSPVGTVEDNPDFEAPILQSGYIDMRTHNDLWLEVKAWIKEAQPELIFWHMKFDAHKLGLYPQADKYQDGCLAVYVINENYPKKLKVVAQRLLKESTDEDEVLKRVRKEMGLTVSDGYEKLPLSVVAPYACRDAEYTLRIWIRLQKAIEAESDFQNVYEMEKQLILAVAGTERRGMRIDLDYVKSKIIELGDQIISYERQISEIVGKPVGDGKKKLRVPDGKYKNGNPKFRTEESNEFNPNSPAQILEFLQAQGEDITATDKEALAAVKHPLGAALRDLRTTHKVRSTYLIPMAEEAVDSILHPNFNLTATKTKRFSSSGVSDS